MRPIYTLLLIVFIAIVCVSAVQDYDLAIDSEAIALYNNLNNDNNDFDFRFALMATGSSSSTAEEGSSSTGESTADYNTSPPSSASSELLGGSYSSYNQISFAGVAVSAFIFLVGLPIIFCCARSPTQHRAVLRAIGAAEEGQDNSVKNRTLIGIIVLAVVTLGANVFSIVWYKYAHFSSYVGSLSPKRSYDEYYGVYGLYSRVTIVGGAEGSYNYEHFDACPDGNKFGQEEYARCLIRHIYPYIVGFYQVVAIICCFIVILSAGSTYCARGERNTSPRLVTFSWGSLCSVVAAAIGYGVGVYFMDDDSFHRVINSLNLTQSNNNRYTHMLDSSFWVLCGAVLLASILLLSARQVVKQVSRRQVKEYELHGRQPVGASVQYTRQSEAAVASDNEYISPSVQKLQGGSFSQQSNFHNQV
jgi:hypothetical protein